MDIVKAETIEPSFKKILITGVEKSGKTSFALTMPRPMIAFCGETGFETRAAGQKDIDIVRCYDQKGETDGSGIRRFQKNYKEMLCMKETLWKTIVIDPLSFLSDYILQEIDRTNPGLKGGSNTFKFWDLVAKEHETILHNILKASEYVVVTSHVTLDEDETTGRQLFMPNLNGKALRNNIGGWFDAVLFTYTKPTGTRTEYGVYALPDGQRKAGIRVPLGCEELVGKEMPSDFNKICAMIKKGIKDGTVDKK